MWKCLVYGLLRNTINDPDLTLEEESVLMLSGLESFPLIVRTSTGTFNIRYFNIDYTLAIKGSQGMVKTLQHITL